jgi:acetoin utilization protein AcuB
MGARKKGVRATVIIDDQPGKLAALSKAVADVGGNFIAFGTFAGEDPTSQLITFKVDGISEDQVRQIAEKQGRKLIDLRTI